MNNGRFAISIHILTLLELSNEELLSSDYIAGSININSVLVRKEITELRKAGLVDSKEGKNGGFFLAKKADDINLGDLFKAVYPESIFAFAKNSPNPNCPIGKDINKHLESLYVEAELSLVQELKRHSLAEFCQKFK
ncbi:transcriptional regulator, BadM/Rrf2 family [Pseudopedobacter saltans DSM 12145]|uniref:Transcriptional regulator, BadM/Rrf2 family n=1 Tax=Pseudopedobacter saltans (strain ATCC 51119 / DSM 12145 / JCM 21818 / CCUG 39354 / LMG 10337 / NBRC 100064 / NCIMB 13643) TaxID=762903 RepID=F0SEV0_PSESL|nr:Rrf2 family transcriptional regulator [Pseudopedobacter saltans]ADY53016.1 transcriptional regulator, BadM/Rrf2 family [Pseudopedobacter saltans DSM 12145]